MNKCGHWCRQNVCRCGWRFTYLLAVVLTAGAAIISYANAAQVNAIWNGGTGNWSDSTAWSGGVVPNNNATDTYLALIDNGNAGIDSHVTLDQATTIDELTVDAGDELTIVNGSLAIANSGFVHNHGLILFGSSQLTLLSGTTTTLDGGGILRLSDSTSSEIFGSGILHNGLEHTIDGSGTITSSANAGVRINNEGTIDANIAGDSLFMKIMTPLSSQNTGVLRASNGGILDFRAPISNSNFNNTGGTIEALADSVVVLNGRIRGGQLSTEAGGTVTITGGVDLELSMEVNNAQGGLIEIPDILGGVEGDVARLTLDGSGTYYNNGTILLSSDFGHPVSLAIRSDVVLQGTGVLRLSNTELNVVRNSASSEGTLTNGIGHTIEGAGQLGNDQIGLVNEGVIAANLPGGDLVISPGHLGSLLNEFVTSGAVAVSPSSRILMGPNKTFQQTNGTTTVDGILETNGGMVQVLGGSLSGTGTIIGPVASGGVVQPGGSIGKLTISGDYTQNAEGALLVEIGGLSPGTEYDVLDISGTATLSGILSVGLANDFSPTLNDTFDILTAGSVMGEFAANALSLPALDPTLFWQIQYLPDVVRLSVVSMTAIPGDYDGDHDVDDADYLAWKGAFGSSVAPGSGADGNQNGIVDAADYVVWRDHYGQSSVANIVSNAVPEPEAWATMLAVVLLGLGKPISCRRCERGDEDGHEN